MKKIPFSMLKKEVASSYVEYVEEEGLNENPHETEERVTEICNTESLDKLYGVLDSLDLELEGRDFVVACLVDETE